MNHDDATGCGRPAPCEVETGYAAGAGERDALTTRREGAEDVFHDPGAVITVTAPCVSVDDHTARCPSAPAIVLLGDGDDRPRTVVLVLAAGPAPATATVRLP